MALSRLEESELDDFADVLLERSRAFQSVAESGALEGVAHLLTYPPPKGGDLMEEADELRYLALFIRHRHKINERHADEGLTFFCLQCVQPTGNLVSLCLICKTDRFLILTN